MCGRYFYDSSDEKLIEIYTKAKQRKNVSFNFGEVFPGQLAPVLVTYQKKIYADFKLWGYHHKIINARLETVDIKPLFKEDFKHRRCVIPMSYFFEWDQKKTRYAFGEQLYLAGFYNDQDEFVILTTTSSGDVSTIHSRMPICLEKKDILDYLQTGNIQNQVPHFVHH